MLSLDGTGWLFKGFYGEDWRWRNAHQPGSRDHIRGWLPARVPGSVLDDLLANGLIPDPHFEQNSLLSEWVCQRTWLYRTNFSIDPAMKGQQIQLVFEGVDYESEFYLNGEHLGNHRGMVTPAVFDLTRAARIGEENLLVVVIHPAPMEQPQVGRTSLVRTNKARMNYWWDFCPRLVHQGIWDRAFIKFSGVAALEDVHVQTSLTEALDRAHVVVSCHVRAVQPFRGALALDLLLGGQVVDQKSLPLDLPAGGSCAVLEFNLDQPRLWWCNGSGAQPLYAARATLVSGENGAPSISDQVEQVFGIRRIRFVPNEGAPSDALPYTLELNGQQIYINGWNWVPMDALYGVERPQKLERLLRLAQQAHVNLLRVWGGGLIEKEAFYQACDRLGILVWQEFIQSSSGIDNIPTTDADFIAEMVADARQIIPRRRNHPSLAIWCGGNELSANGIPLDDSHPMLGALKSVVSQLDPDRAWLPTSASGPVCGFGLAEIEKDPTRLHDVHGPWEYQGLEQHYTLYNRGASLYHSEFGVEGLTNLRALNRVIAPEHQFPVNRNNPVWFHLGACWVKVITQQQAFGEFADIRQAVIGAQFLQYEGLRYAVEADRRRWPGNSGTSPWQFNEPFPMAACTSAVDYFAEPKPAYEAVRQAYEPVHLSASYARLAWGGQVAFEATLWGSNAGAALDGSLTWQVQDLSGAVIRTGKARAALPANCTARLVEVACPLDEIRDDLFFLTCTFASADGKVNASSRCLFSKMENLAPIFRLPKAHVSLKTKFNPEDQTGEAWLKNTGQHAALGVWLEHERNLSDTNYVYFDRNYIHLLPGEAALIKMHLSSAGNSRLSVTLSGWNI